MVSQRHHHLSSTIRYLRFLLPLLALLPLAGCDRDSEQGHNSYASQLTDGGDAERGRARIRQYGCTACHTIPGIREADGIIGPPLDRMANRMYVGGVVKNTPENLKAWILNPPSIDDKTAMPNLHVTESDAKDIACYLYTLR